MGALRLGDGLNGGIGQAGNPVVAALHLGLDQDLLLMPVSTRLPPRTSWFSLMRQRDAVRPSGLAVIQPMPFMPLRLSLGCSAFGQAPAFGPAMDGAIFRRRLRRVATRFGLAGAAQVDDLSHSRGPGHGYRPGGW